MKHQTTTKQPRTSRGAPAQQRSVLAILRALAPARPLNAREALVIAELQALRLLELAGVQGPPTPSETISHLPRVVVDRRRWLHLPDAPRWEAGRWLLPIDSSRPQSEQRLAMAEHLKRAVDHRDRAVLYGREQPAAQTLAAEAAEHFALCLLLPKRWLISTWQQGTHDLRSLTTTFMVTGPAVVLRLQQLGLGSARIRRAHRSTSASEGQS